MMKSAGRRVEEMCALREADLEQLHRAQRDTLELEISWLPKPRIKYTNRYLELDKTNAGYIKLMAIVPQYDITLYFSVEGHACM